MRNAPRLARLATLIVPLLIAAASVAAAQPGNAGLRFPSVGVEPLEPRPEVASTDNSADRPVPFKELICDIPGDFKHFPSKETAIWLTLGTVGSLAVHPYDVRITDSLSGNESLGDVFRPGDVLGGFWVQGGAAALTYAIGLAAGSPSLSRLGSDLIRAQVLSQTVTLGFKLAVHRTRPDGGRFSFPSGHATATFASAVVLQKHFGWKAGIPAYVVAGYVGIARVQGRHHYPSDVVFGAMVGVAGARTVTGQSDVVSGTSVEAASAGTVTLRIGGTRLHVAAVPIPRGVYLRFVASPHR